MFVTVDAASKSSVELRIATRPFSSTAAEPKPEAKGGLAIIPTLRMCIMCSTNLTGGECPFRWHTAVKNTLKQQVVPSNWFKPQISYGKR